MISVEVLILTSLFNIITGDILWGFSHFNKTRSWIRDNKHIFNALLLSQELKNTETKKNSELKPRVEQQI